MALTHGAFEYLIKPFSRQDLEDVVRRALLRRQADLGARGQVARLVEEMRRLAAKTRELEEAARREAAEQSLRVTQLSILREIARTIVGQLDPHASHRPPSPSQLRRGARLRRRRDRPRRRPATAPRADAAVVVTCAIRDAEGPLGYLVVDNRPSRPGRSIRASASCWRCSPSTSPSRCATPGCTARSPTPSARSSSSSPPPATPSSPSRADDRIEGWNPAAERIFGLAAAQALGRPITDLLPARPTTATPSAGSPTARRCSAFEVDGDRRAAAAAGAGGDAVGAARAPGRARGAHRDRARHHRRSARSRASSTSRRS